MSNTQLNPDAILEAARASRHALQDEDFWGFSSESDAQDYGFEEGAKWAQKQLAVAQPEVNSVEELDQLPMHSYVQGNDGFKHAKDWKGGWHLIVNRPSSAPHLSGSIELPARVLYRPEVES